MTTEPKIRVTFLDMNGGNQLSVEIRAYYTVEQTIQRLIQAQFLNSPQPGQEYVLVLQRENRRLLPGQNLRDAGVQNGDSIQALAQMRGG